MCPLRKYNSHESTGHANAEKPQVKSETRITVRKEKDKEKAK
jgi:hypothetical protein